MLRSIIFSISLITVPFSSFAQDDSLLNLEVLKKYDDQAKDYGKTLSDTLTPLTYDGDVTLPDMPSRREMADSFPELKAFMDKRQEQAEIDALENGRKPSELGVILVSFSMPEQSLREVALQADRYGLTAVFAGLHGNNFTAMLTKLNDVFGDDIEAMKGFSINPTIFNRFNVNRVPAYIFLDKPLEPCKSQGCKDDLLPNHDIVYGNIPFASAAEIVIQNDGIGKQSALDLLAGVLRED